MVAWSAICQKQQRPWEYDVRCLIPHCWLLDYECVWILISKIIRFGTVIWDCDEPIYSGALYLLALALADNALYAFSSLKEVFKQRILEGQDELVLRWNEEAKDWCIVREFTAEGVSEDLLMKEAYQADFQKILANACYFVTVTVHAMHHVLGAAVKGQSLLFSPFNLSPNLAKILRRKILIGSCCPNSYPEVQNCLWKWLSCQLFQRGCVQCSDGQTGW